MKNNELLRESAKIIEFGRPMPIIPEMRAIWDALRTQYQAVLGGNTTPENASRLAQENAIKQIREMNEVIQPGKSAIAIKWFVPLFIITAIIVSRRHFKEFIKSIKNNPHAYIFVLPAFLGIFMVVIFPFIYNIIISLSNLSLKTFQSWELIGFHHYINVFKEKIFYLVFFKTVIWTVVNLFFHVSIGVFLAVLINRTLPAKKTNQFPTLKSFKR